MRNVVFIVTVVFILQQAGFAQLKSRHFWPATTDFSIKNFHLNFRQSEGDINKQFFLNDCIEGNCKNGEGVFAVTNARKVEFRENGSLELTINLYKGTFSDDGKKFKGKMLAYNYTLNGSNAKSRDFYANKFTPIKSESLSEDIEKSILASNYVIAEGEAIRIEEKWGDKIKYSYVLHGIGASREAMLELGAVSMYGIYENGKLQLLETEIKQEFPAKKFTGRMNFKNKPLVGKLEFKDGTYYEGFFYGNSYNGPGRLVNSDGKIYEGFWEKGILKDSQRVDIPASLWSRATNVLTQSNPYTLMIADKSYTGVYTGEWENGKPHGKGVFTGQQELFFYGNFKNGMPEGLGYFYRLYIKNRVACCEQKTEEVSSGMFSKGWLSIGSHYTVNYQWFTGPSDKNYLRGFIKDDSYEAYGTFKDGALDGCGKLVYRRWEGQPELSRTYIGTFKAGYGLHGWATVDYPYKSIDNKWKGKYTGYFIYNPVSPYAERQDLITSVYPSVTPSDGPKFYSDFEKEVEIFLKEVTAGSVVCDELVFTDTEKKKYIQEAKDLGLYARKRIVNYNNRPLAPSFVSNYDNAVKQIKYMTGTTLLNSGATSVITGYDFNNNKYEVSAAIYKSVYGMGGQFKGLKDAVVRNWLTEKEIESRFKVQTVIYSMCATCNGKGSTTGTVHGGNKGGWEKWTDNVFYNRPSTAYSYEVTTGCSNCKMVGWR